MKMHAVKTMLSKIMNDATWIVAVSMLMLSPACGRDDDRVDQPKDIPGVQILSNTSAEEGSGSPDHWDVAEAGPQPGNAYVFEWSATEAYSGGRSLLIRLDNVVDMNAFAYWDQSIDSDIPHGKELVLKASVKTNLTGQGAGIMVRVDDTSGPVAWATTQGYVSITGAEDWHAVSTALDKVPEGATKIWVFLMIFPETTGSIYFDDIELTYK